MEFSMMECKIIRLAIRIEEADGQFAAECVELGTATCGDTYEDAEKKSVKLLTFI